MPELLVLCEYPTLNGGEHSFLSTVPTVQAAGFNITVAAPADGPFAESCARANLEIIPFDPRADGRFNQSHARSALAEILRRRFDLLHANSLAMARLSGPVAAETRIRSIGHVRDIVGLSQQAVRDVNMHRRLLAVSQATRAYHIAQGIDADRIAVLYNGVDLQTFKPEPAPTAETDWPLPADAVVIGTIGQLIRRKGQDVLAAAAPAIAGAAPKAHFAFVGERYSQKDEAIEFLAGVHQTFESAGLQDRVHFFGRRSDVARLLPRFDVLVHAARQEPLGRVLLEGAACGCAIVATDVGGTREIFPPGDEAAILVPADDPAALALAVVNVLSDRALADRLRRSARRRAEAAFDVQQASARLVEHYRDVLA